MAIARWPFCRCKRRSRVSWLTSPTAIGWLTCVVSTPPICILHGEESDLLLTASSRLTSLFWLPLSSWTQTAAAVAVTGNSGAPRPHAVICRGSLRLRCYRLPPRASQLAVIAWPVSKMFRKTTALWLQLSPPTTNKPQQATCGRAGLETVHPSEAAGMKQVASSRFCGTAEHVDAKLIGLSTCSRGESTTRLVSGDSPRLTPLYWLPASAASENTTKCRYMSRRR